MKKANAYAFDTSLMTWNASRLNFSLYNFQNFFTQIFTQEFCGFFQ